MANAPNLDPKIMAKWIEDTYKVHEASWEQGTWGNYKLSWEQASKQVVPEPWDELVYAMCASGYCDFPDWAQRQLEPEGEGRRPDHVSLPTEGIVVVPLDDPKVLHETLKDILGE